MSALNQLQLAAMTRLQGRFKAASNTHGPLRCVLIHQEGDDFRLRLSPPSCEDMPATAPSMGALYSYRLHCRAPDGEEDLCKTATIGTGRNPFQAVDEPVDRYEPFAERKVYLLRNHKSDMFLWPVDTEDLRVDPKWQELCRRTNESHDVFWRLASEAGRCFGGHDCDTLPEMARESLEASEDGCRWLWIVFDLAWRRVRGSPLQADRSIWREVEGEGGHFYAWELNTDRHWAAEWKRASSPKSCPDEAKRIQKWAYLKDWAERPPAFYYSHLDDLFLASVWAIDLLTIREPAPVVVRGLADGEQKLKGASPKDKQGGGKGRGSTKAARLGKPLLKDEARDRMLEDLSRDGKHRRAYAVVYAYWGEPNANLLRTIEMETHLGISNRSRISHMRTRMVKWAEKHRPQKPSADHEATAEQILKRLRKTYVEKVMSRQQWEQLVGTPTEPGDVRSEIDASFVEHDGDRDKASAAARRLIDKWLRERGRTGQCLDADGELSGPRDQ